MNVAIYWQKLPEMISGPPYDGEQVLLAVQNPIAGGGLDPDFPFSIHLGRWDEDQGEWATNEASDQDDGILWLKPQAPTFWAEIDLPF
jgi:hypothetical protein